MGKKEMLSVIDSNGEEKIVKLITYFTLLNNENDYIAYTEYDDNDDNIKVYIGRLEFNGEKIYLRTIEEEDEIEYVKDVLVNLANTPETGFNYVLNNIDIILKTGNKLIKDINNIFMLKEVFVNNIMDNYEYILNKQDETFDYLDKNELFIEVDMDDDYNVDVEEEYKEYADTNNVNSDDKLDFDLDKFNEELKNIFTPNNINVPDNTVDIEQINNEEYSINDAKISDIEIPKFNEANEVKKDTSEHIPIDIQIKIDLNNEKIRYLNILKRQIDNEIDKLEDENNYIYKSS